MPARAPTRFSTDTHRGCIPGKSHCDTTPPTRALVCHLVLPCATDVAHARHMRRSLCPAILLPQCSLLPAAALLPPGSSAAAARLTKPKTPRCSETSWRTRDSANTHPCGQGVSLFRARSRPVLHEASKSLYSVDLGWFGGQLSPIFLALAFLALQDQALHPGPPERDTHPLLALHSQRSINSTISRFSSSQMRTMRVSLLRNFFSFSFFKQTSAALLKLWEVYDCADLGTTLPKRSDHHLGLRNSPMRPNEFWTCPHDGAARVQQAPGCQRSSCGSVWRGRLGRGDWCSQQRS